MNIAYALFGACCRYSDDLTHLDALALWILALSSSAIDRFQYRYPKFIHIARDGHAPVKVIS